ncbi:hypothetical protein CXB38_21725 [Pseudomonas syringae]|uniref:hypothetical protein n=1 Tax=Pseudomonas syringae TaxID=317 RepID=UPI000CDA1879|nr:hypothetical protein [Pseudomonas syringae]POP78432.1 hypothetical protein CXB38_21725 [Pseudomonas syringae]
MKRKFVTEFGLGYMNSYTSMTTAHQLIRGGEMSSIDQENLAKCHIYIIAARPAPYFKPENLKHESDTLSGSVYYRIDGKEHEIPFGGYRWKLEHEAAKIECKYPYREIRSYNPDGKEGTYVPASALTLMYLREDESGANDLNRYEVLYLGQAFGQGNRSAMERLKSHSTLQKILAMTNHDYPDREIMIFMYQFENDQVFTSIDGRAKDADNSPKNEARLMNTINNPPNKQQKIGMIEAGLIRFFQPHYNKIFKIKFPSTKHKVLKSCYDLDVTSLIVELDSTDLNYFLYSPTVSARDHHIAKLDLVASQNRYSFFHATDFVEMPDLIKG